MIPPTDSSERSLSTLRPSTRKFGSLLRDEDSIFHLQSKSGAERKRTRWLMARLKTSLEMVDRANQITVIRGTKTRSHLTPATLKKLSPLTTSKWKKLRAKIYHRSLVRLTRLRMMQHQ
jgi:hypothetical protein